MKHKFYYWETLDANIKMIEFNNFSELLKSLETLNLPNPKQPEHLDCLLSLGEKTIYAFPIKENYVSVLAWYDNLNMARKEREWFTNLKKDTNGKGKRIFSYKK